MDLPIVPSFFKKLDVYQRLKDAEKDMKDKSIWEAEKTVLIWAAGPDHQLVGSFITEEHIKDIVEKEFMARAIKGDETATKLIDYALVFRNQVLEALVMRDFAVERLPEGRIPYGIRINPDGFLAGNILLNTSSLTKNWRYQSWIWAWWLVLALGILLLLEQVLPDLWHVLDHIYSSLKTFLSPKIVWISILLGLRCG